jgi:hypothetical protein
MSRFTWCAALCAALLFSAPSNGAVIINELQADDGGTDDREFVELYNSSGVTEAIGNWTLNRSDVVGAKSVITIPAGTTLAPGAYYVIGQSATVLNVNQSVGASFLEDQSETIELRDNTGTVMDAVVLEAFRGPTTATNGYGTLTPAVAAQVGPGIFAGGNNTNDVAGTPLNGLSSVGRFVDGRDTNNNGRDFGNRPSTPGTSNNTGFMTFYTPPDPTGQTVGAVVPGLAGSFVDAKFIDPTVADGTNTNAIAPAPSTGNRAIIVFDPSGGGNNAASKQVFNTTQGGFGISAYFATSALPQQTSAAGANQFGSELTTYGIGGSDSVVNLTDLAGNVTSITAATLPSADNSNGVTGVSWVYERTAVNGATQATAVLYLVDANDGGDSDLGGNTPMDWTVLQAINIANLPNGWYDLGISVDALGNGVATFNGSTFNFTTSTAMHSGAFNAGYRENLNMGSDATPDAVMRPATFTIIPEPGTLALAALGLVSLVVRRKR